MKKFMFLLLSVAMVFTLSSLTLFAQEKNTKIKVAATSNLSTTPADEGVHKIESFVNGDNTYGVNADSPKNERKAAVKMAFELYKSKRISYDQYADLCQSLKLKPKPLSKH